MLSDLSRLIQPAGDKLGFGPGHGLGPMRSQSQVGLWQKARRSTQVLPHLSSMSLGPSSPL